MKSLAENKFLRAIVTSIKHDDSLNHLRYDFSLRIVGDVAVRVNKNQTFTIVNEGLTLTKMELFALTEESIAPLLIATGQI